MFNYREFIVALPSYRKINKRNIDLETTDRTGEWEFNDETSEITIGSKEKRPGEGTFKLSWVDKNTIYITIDRGNKVYLRRIE